MQRVLFSSAEAAQAQVIVPNSSASVMGPLLQASAGAAESSLVLSGTDLTLSFRLAGNGPCDPATPVAPQSN